MTDIYYDSVISEYGDACAALQEEINTLRARAEKAEADCAAVIVDTARELGCFADNEGIFAAIATLQADYKRAEAELKAMREALEKWRAARAAFLALPPIGPEPENRVPSDIWQALATGEQELYQLANRAALAPS